MATGRSTWAGYGRTRRPKNIAGPDGTAVASVADLAAAKSVTDASTNADKTGTGVYATENQRFLHVCTYNTGAISKIYGYTYASGNWGELKTSGGSSWAISAGTHGVITIAGVDLVAFTLANSTTVYAACSTF